MWRKVPNVGSSETESAVAAIRPDDGDGSHAMPRHVAIIMDGNGRWAAQRGLPRQAGHQQGVEAVRRVVKAARKLGVDYLTLFSFSSENWSRPQSEISDLMRLLRLFVRRDLAELHKNNVRVKIVGRRTQIDPDILKMLDESVSLTRENTGMTLVVAFNYGARDEIVDAMQRIGAMIERGEIAADSITPDLVAKHLDTRDVPDPDLLIRTSGEQRISNFLLWQLAYTEFVFADENWPDYSAKHLERDIDIFRARNRRFGGLGQAQSI